MYGVYEEDSTLSNILKMDRNGLGNKYIDQYQNILSKVLH